MCERKSGRPTYVQMQHFSEMATCLGKELLFQFTVRVFRECLSISFFCGGGGVEGDLVS